MTRHTRRMCSPAASQLGDWHPSASAASSRPPTSTSLRPHSWSRGRQGLPHLLAGAGQALLGPKEPCWPPQGCAGVLPEPCNSDSAVLVAPARWQHIAANWLASQQVPTTMFTHMCHTWQGWPTTLAKNKRWTHPIQTTNVFSAPGCSNLWSSFVIQPHSRLQPRRHIQCGDPAGANACVFVLNCQCSPECPGTPQPASRSLGNPSLPTTLHTVSVITQPRGVATSLGATKPFFQ